jgi:hypothetical protein
LGESLIANRYGKFLGELQKWFKILSSPLPEKKLCMNIDKKWAGLLICHTFSPNNLVALNANATKTYIFILNHSDNSAKKTFR